METFANLPTSISDAIEHILSPMDHSLLASRAKDLHERYMSREKLKDNSYIQSTSDIYAYCALRAPATHAQIYSALAQVKELTADFQPTSLLDLGSGPGTAVWAAKTLWPSVTTATCVDQEKTFLTVGKEILSESGLTVNTTWQQQDIRHWIESDSESKYDLIVVANVFNELSDVIYERVLSQLQLRSSGIVVILEPGTSIGYSIIRSISKTLSLSQPLVAPYINHSFVEHETYWIHFPQKFKRPEFQRAIRQRMRESALMASDWEETKYSYVAFGKVSTPSQPFARCIGPITKQKGFVVVPLLTQEGIVDARVLKRHKAQYAVAKNLRSGEIVWEKSDIYFPSQ